MRELGGFYFDEGIAFDQLLVDRLGVVGLLLQQGTVKGHFSGIGSSERTISKS